MKACQKRQLFSSMLLFVVPAFAVAQAPDVNVSATASKKAVDLSESLVIKLSVEGPAPIRVELPKQLLVPESDRDWKFSRWGLHVTSLARSVSDGFSISASIVRLRIGQTVLFAPLKVNGREIQDQVTR